MSYYTPHYVVVSVLLLSVLSRRNCSPQRRISLTNLENENIRKPSQTILDVAMNILTIRPSIVRRVFILMYGVVNRVITLVHPMGGKSIYREYIFSGFCSTEVL